MEPSSSFVDKTVYYLKWQDAAYSYHKELPPFPAPQITVGFIVERNDDFTKIATNVHYNPEKDTLEPVDGFLIPNGVIIKRQPVGKVLGDN